MTKLDSDQLGDALVCIVRETFDKRQTWRGRLLRRGNLLLQTLRCGDPSFYADVTMQYGPDRFRARLHAATLRGSVAGPILVVVHDGPWMQDIWDWLAEFFERQMEWEQTRAVKPNETTERTEA